MVRAAEPDAVAEARAALEAAQRKLDQAKAGISGGDKPTSTAEAAAPAAASDAASGSEAPVQWQANGVTDLLALKKARSLVDSPLLRNAAAYVLRLVRAPGGQDALGGLVTRSCESLEASKEDWSAIMGDPATWDTAGIERDEALGAFKAATRLLRPLDGVFEAIESTSDRGAVLEAVAYDQKPDTARGYIPIFDLEEKSQLDGMDPNAATELDFVDPRVERIKKDPEIREAARFAKRLESLSDESQVRERYRRLLDMPLMRAAADMVAEDEDLATVMQVLEPYGQRLYNATRIAQLRLRPASDLKDDKVQVVTLELSTWQILAGLAFVVILAFGASQSVKNAVQPGSQVRAGDNLPTYGLSRSYDSGR